MKNVTEFRIGFGNTKIEAWKNKNNISYFRKNQKSQTLSSVKFAEILVICSKKTVILTAKKGGLLRYSQTKPRALDGIRLFTVFRFMLYFPEFQNTVSTEGL